ncbi:MAG: gamma-glutamylcyclotransferase family protein [Bacillota bacterium]|nr:gamma-glutamylcyclotransferase family protein [Bacillota bacterium]
MVNKVFVYGTLLSGLSNHRVVKPYVVDCKAAKTVGQLYHLPYGYPAVIDSDSEQKIIGELLELKEAEPALKALDRLEGYIGPGDRRNLYERIVQEVVMTDCSRVLAYIYVWANPEKLDRIGELVPDGDWRAYMKKLHCRNNIGSAKN